MKKLITITLIALTKLSLAYVVYNHTFNYVYYADFTNSGGMKTWINPYSSASCAPSSSGCFGDIQFYVNNYADGGTRFYSEMSPNNQHSNLFAQGATNNYIYIFNSGIYPYLRFTWNVDGREVQEEYSKNSCEAC